MKATAKRRRSKAQIKEEQKDEQRKQMEIAKKLAKYDEMEKQVEQTQSLIEEKESYRQLCSSMYDNGIIKQDENGTFVPVEDPLERESIRSKSKMKQEAQIDSSVIGKEFNASILEDDNDKMDDLQ